MPLSPSRSLRVLVVAAVWWMASAHAQPAQDPAAVAALDRMVGYFGGPDVVYGVRTLAVAGEARRAGDALVVTTRTMFAFPLHVRREFLVAERSLAFIAGPDGAMLVTQDGTARLTDTERVTFERSTMRDPVALAKVRLGRGVAIALDASTTIDGVAVDLVRVTQVDNETVLAIAVGDGRLVAIRYALDARATIAVRFDEWTMHPPGLRYPGRARGTIDGNPAFDFVVRRVDVDPPLAPVLFAGEDDPPPRTLPRKVTR